MLVNRTQRRKKFLVSRARHLGSFYRGKSSLMHVVKHHVLRQLYSVSVDFQQFEDSFSSCSIKEDLTESFHVKRRRLQSSGIGKELSSCLVFQTRGLIIL